MLIELQKSAKSGAKVLVQQDYNNPVEWTVPRTMDVCVSYIFIVLEINIYIHIEIYIYLL